MKKILMVYPHFPPSNLAGVHRPRLFAQHLKSFGWEPVILTVDEKYYEEELDWNLNKLLPTDLRIEKVKAFAITKPRLIGDIGLRSFFQLRKRALQLIRNEKFDFVYIPIPSFYVSLLGPYLKKMTGVNYGIDYIDPWVHNFPGSEKIFSRHWLSSQLAKWLEPKAIKNASLITGVSEGYYKGVVERNPQLVNKCIFGAMPYGGEPVDHLKMRELNLAPYLFKKNGKIQLVYAGAILPKSYVIIESIFQVIKTDPEIFNNVEIHFIGTGKIANDPNYYSIKALAEKYNLWNTNIFEYPKRIPYMDVLIHLENSDGIFIIGSTEPHYSPSKVFQAVLSKKSILAILHEKSSAINVIKKYQAGIVLAFNGEDNLDSIKIEFTTQFQKWKTFNSHFINKTEIKLDLEEYSAFASTKKLAELLNQIV